MGSRQTTDLITEVHLVTQLTLPGVTLLSSLGLQLSVLSAMGPTDLGLRSYGDLSVVVELTWVTAVQARSVCGVEHPLFPVAPRTIWHASGTVKTPMGHASLRSWLCDLMSSTSTHVRPRMVSFGFRWRG